MTWLAAAAVVLIAGGFWLKPLRRLGSGEWLGLPSGAIKARGYNGRNPDDATWDVKLGYRWNLGKSNLDFNILVTNLFNMNQVNAYNDFVENQTGILNPNYLTPLGVHEPRTVRLGAKWSF